MDDRERTVRFVYACAVAAADQDPTAETIEHFVTGSRGAHADTFWRRIAAYVCLRDCGITPAEIAAITGRSRSWVTDARITTEWTLDPARPGFHSPRATAIREAVWKLTSLMLPSLDELFPMNDLFGTEET